MKLRVQLGPEAVLPKYQTEQAAGMDLCSTVSAELQPLERRLFPTGLSIVIPDGYEGQVRPRSGLALKKGLGMVNAPGTIDSDYRGEVGVILINLSDSVVQIEKGERVAQLVICPVVRAEIEVIDDVSEFPSGRGEGGFGSTGIQG